jgi:hypothetical protein
MQFSDWFGLNQMGQIYRLLVALEARSLTVKVTMAITP